MTLDPTFVSNLILVLTGFGGAFLAALWISLVIWTYRDIRTRARDPLVQTLATLLVAILNLPGILVYLILRPPRTLEEEYQRTLEEEALLQALEDLPSRMIGRSVRTVIPSSRRTVRIVTGLWSCHGTSVRTAGRPRQVCAGIQVPVSMKPYAG
jgi:hypothetical protein